LDLSCIDLPTDSPNGTFIGLHVVYDPIKGSPILSNTLFNSLNTEFSTANRSDAFKKLLCLETLIGQIACGVSIKPTLEQKTYANRSFTPWDRGHLSPSLPFTYSDQANAQTFLCVNIAPQDWFTNQQPWRLLEDGVLNYFVGERAGYVMTGTCDQNLPGFMSKTLDGFNVPACFWKMVCYKDDAGVTQVVSFVGNNAITRGGNAADMADRRKTVCEPRGQQDVLNLLSADLWPVVRSGWTDGEAVLLPGRQGPKAPLASECVEKMMIDEAVKQDWVTRLHGC